MKVLICGGRDYADSERVSAVMDEIHGQGEGSRVTLVIEGGARGADTLGKLWAFERGVPCTEVKADWARFGRAAGPLRNQAMLDMQPDLVVAFHPNLAESKGTADTVRRAKAMGIRVTVVS